jgi:hypothetical protein
MLTGNDTVVLVQLAAKAEPWTFRSLGDALDIDPAALHRSVARLKAARLLDQERQVNQANVEEFLIHGLRFLLPAELGPLGRGVPTAWGAEPLRSKLAPGEEPPPVWPDPNGTSRGPSIKPIGSAVPKLAEADPVLGEWFALIDGVRVGRARERKLAAEELGKRIWALTNAGP